jgi:hypothetical protein
MAKYLVRIAFLNNTGKQVTIPITTGDAVGWVELSSTTPPTLPDGLLSKRPAATWDGVLDPGQVFGFATSAEAQFIAPVGITVVYANGKDPWPMPPPPPPKGFGDVANFAVRYTNFLAGVGVSNSEYMEVPHLLGTDGTDSRSGTFTPRDRDQPLRFSPPVGSRGA